jgi:hypothetical protein
MYLHNTVKPDLIQIYFDQTCSNLQVSTNFLHLFLPSPKDYLVEIKEQDFKNLYLFDSQNFALVQRILRYWRSEGSGKLDFLFPI